MTIFAYYLTAWGNPGIVETNFFKAETENDLSVAMEEVNSQQPLERERRRKKVTREPSTLKDEIEKDAQLSYIRNKQACMEQSGLEAAPIQEEEDQEPVDIENIQDEEGE